MAIMRLSLPRGRQLLGTIVFGALNFGGAFAFAYYTLVHMNAGSAGALLALTPVVTLCWQSRNVRRGSDLERCGSASGLRGVGFISSATLQASSDGGVVAALGSVLCFAEAAVIARWFQTPIL